MFSKQELLALNRQRHVVEVPVLGSVGLRRLTAKDMTDRETLTISTTDQTTQETTSRKPTNREETAFLIARVLIDESGARVFEDADWPLIIEHMPLEASGFIAKAILTHNGIAEVDGDKAAEKN